jgi:hypothetical protein
VLAVERLVKAGELAQAAAAWRQAACDLEALDQSVGALLESA